MQAASLTRQAASISLLPSEIPRDPFMSRLHIMPSVLAADMGALRAECRRAVEAGADGLHLDIMDGHFVPNLSMGPAIVAMIRDAVDTHLSVHLMLSRPDRYLDAFIDAGADTLHVHVEADCDVADALRAIRARGVRSGLALNPDTPAEALAPFVAASDEILVMTVHPGFGGQAFIRDVLPKIGAVRAASPTIDIAVDGGINVECGAETVGQGANILIAGSFLFTATDMRAEIERMRQAAEAATLDRI